MTAWNWSKLLARSATGRQAIYDERFKGRWDELLQTVEDDGSIEFTEQEASQLLTVFAVSWEHLPSSRVDPDARYHLVAFDVARTTGHIAISFVAGALRHDQIVITHPLVVRRF